MAVVTLEPSESWKKDYEEQDNDDTSPLHVPLSDNSQLTQEEVDKIDPFSFSPPFTLFDKLLVSTL